MHTLLLNEYCDTLNKKEKSFFFKYDYPNSRCVTFDWNYSPHSIGIFNDNKGVNIKQL